MTAYVPPGSAQPSGCGSSPTPRAFRPTPVRFVSQDELFANADAVSLNCPQTTDNTGFVNNRTPLLTAPNCVITPHIAWASLAARKRLMDIVVANVASFIKGEPINVVNRQYLRS